MTDPFRKISVFDQQQTPFEDDPDFEPKEDPPTQVVVKCKICKGDAVKSDVDGQWVHSLETISMGVKNGLAPHNADPDIIDVEEVTDD